MNKINKELIWPEVEQWYGDWDVDHELWLECWGCESCQFDILIIDETTIVLLDSLAHPQSNGIKIKLLNEGLPTEWLTEALPTWLVWLRNGTKFCCNQTEWNNNNTRNSHDLPSRWLRFANQGVLHKTLNLSEFQTCISAQILLLPNLPWRFWPPRPTYLPPVLAGGSMVNSS